MKQTICTAVGMIGSAIASVFGGWDAGTVTLLIFMAIDYVSGLVVAGVFHKSNKTDTGSLESKAGWKGLCRKCMTISLVENAGLMGVKLPAVITKAIDVLQKKSEEE